MKATGPTTPSSCSTVRTTAAISWTSSGVMASAAAGATCGTPTVGTDEDAGAMGIGGAMLVIGVPVGAATIGDIGAVGSVGVVHSGVVRVACAPPAGVVTGPTVPSATTVLSEGVSDVLII